MSDLQIKLNDTWNPKTAAKLSAATRDELKNNKFHNKNEKLTEIDDRLPEIAINEEGDARRREDQNEIWVWILTGSASYG